MNAALKPGLVLSFALILAAGASGCGGDGDSDTTQAQTGGAGQTTQAQTGGAGQAGAEAKVVTIKMGDFFFKPKNPKISPPTSGTVTIAAPNVGQVEHELVLFKTDMNPAQLPTAADGGVDEEKLDKQAEEAGEIADVEPGESKSGKFDLSPGNYVMFCNVPGHYAQGMYGTITVTQ